MSTSDSASPSQRDRLRQLWEDVRRLERDPVVMAEQRAQWARIDAEPEVGAQERDW